MMSPEHDAEVVVIDGATIPVQEFRNAELLAKEIDVPVGKALEVLRLLKATGLDTEMQTR